MNIFQAMAEKFRGKVAPPPMPKPYIVKDKVRVPAGFTMPLGDHIVTPFWLTVEAGVRWHPEWAEPRTTVNAFRIMAMGDALSFSGEEALVFDRLLNPKMVALAKYHGQIINPASQKLLDQLGVEAPAKRQELSTFNSWRHN